MKHLYSRKCEAHLAAVLDLVEDHDKERTFIITRINVPASYRGQGIGRGLLEAVMEDADEESITLKIQPAAYADSPMTTEMLIDWYERNDFVLIPNSWHIRVPHH